MHLKWMNNKCEWENFESWMDELMKGNNKKVNEWMV